MAVCATRKLGQEEEEEEVEVVEDHLNGIRGETREGGEEEVALSRFAPPPSSSVRSRWPANEQKIHSAKISRVIGFSLCRAAYIPRHENYCAAWRPLRGTFTD